MKLKFLLILLFVWSASYSQRNIPVVFQQEYVDSIDYNLDSILLVGVGSITTRIFLEDLSQYIIQDFQERNIIAKYVYLGKTMSEAKLAFDTVEKKGYKAILGFFPREIPIWISMER